MPKGLYNTLCLLGSSPTASLRAFFIVSIFSLAVSAQTSAPPTGDSELWERSDNNPLNIDWGPAPSPEDGPPGARNALRNPAYLPAQIGGIVGSYAFSLVLVALILLVLSKKRREHLRAAETEDFDEWGVPAFHHFDNYQEEPFQSQDHVYDQSQFPPHLQHLAPPGHVRNFSLPSPTAQNFSAHNLPVPSPTSHKFDFPNEATSPSSYLPSPVSTTRGPLGQSPEVDQDIVRKDRVMAQTQLEQMYKYVMEQEEAKEAGVEFHAPMTVNPPMQQQQQQQQQRSSLSGFRREKNKPASLNLSKGEKTQSRTSSILSALKSPLGKKKPQVQGMSISSPIMTPMSSTFPPQYAGEEMSSIPPRQYAPARPPPVPMDSATAPGPALASFSQRRNTGHIAPLTPPDLSPESTQSIDERLGGTAAAKSQNLDAQRSGDISEEDEEDQQRELGGAQPHAITTNTAHSRHVSAATTEADPMSAVSESSQAPLVAAAGPRLSGLPTSPKPGVNRFPSLPASPKPGASFSRPNAPSAVRTGGMLPLRAYEPALMSPGTYDRTVKQTVFERAGPMSPGGMHTARTPMTGNPVPYSPYQPFSPVVPITPSLVTKADRKRMKRLEPKTPTLQMVKSDDELW